MNNGNTAPGNTYISENSHLLLRECHGKKHWKDCNSQNTGIGYSIQNKSSVKEFIIENYFINNTATITVALDLLMCKLMCVL